MNGLRAHLQLEEEILFGLRPRQEPVNSSTIVLASAPPGLAGLRQQAQEDAGRRFLSLLHHVDVELLKNAYDLLKIEGARGGGGRTWTEYGRDLDASAVRLYTRLQRGQHLTLPSWRRMMAMAQGQRISLKRAALKDRIVQRAVASVLAAIYEPGFLQFVHEDARSRLLQQPDRPRPRWIVEVPVARFHDAIHTKFLLRSLESRVADPVLMKLIDQWLKADLLQDAMADASEGDLQPFNALARLLADIYYHYGFDLWAERWRQRHARSTVVLARDRRQLLAVFEHKPGARRFQLDLRARLRQFMPDLPPKKVRLSGFDRFLEQSTVR